MAPADSVEVAQAEWLDTAAPQQSRADRICDG